MTLYRGVAERLVEVYDFDWRDNDRMKEACVCSVENVIANIINILLIAVLALVSGLWLEVIIYFFTFAALRCYAGGAHAANHSRCITIYTCVMLVCIWSVKVLLPSSLLYTGMLGFAGMLMSGGVNNKYAAKQKTIGNRRIPYRKKVFCIYCTICVIMIVIFGIYALTGKDIYRQIVLIQTSAAVAQSVGVFVGRDECTE